MLKGLEEKGFGRTELTAIRRAIQADKSDIFDVLAYVAFLSAPITRSERVETRRAQALESYDAKLQTFLDFVLAQYVAAGVDELDQEKLGQLVSLRYGSVEDATRAIGSVAAIRDAFIGFQKHLFQG